MDASSASALAVSAEMAWEFTGSVAPSRVKLSWPVAPTCRRVAGMPFMDSALSVLPSTSTV